MNWIALFFSFFILNGCTTLPKYFTKNEESLKDFCFLVFKSSGYTKYKKSALANCMIRATGLEMKRTGYERAIITIDPTSSVNLISR